MKGSFKCACSHIFRYSILVICIIISQINIFAQSSSKFVGQSLRCEISPVGSVTDLKWSCSGGYVTLTGSGYYRDATITQYYSGTAVIQASWYYTLYSGGPRTRQSKTWHLACQDNPVTLKPETMELSVGESKYVSASLSYDVNASYADIRFVCTTSDVISVNERTGKVTAIGSGTAYVNCYSKVSSNSPYCYVKVKQVDPTDVSLTAPDPIYIGQKVTLTPRLYPDNAQTTYSWSSNDKTVAEVNNGVVTGKSVGTARITVTTANNLSASCDVEVYKPVPSKIELNKSSLRLPVGGKETLTYNVSPSYAIYSVTWESDAPEIVSVNNGQLEAKSPGIANISVITDNDKKSVCKVTVPPEPTAVIVKPSELELLMGRTKTLTCSYIPVDAATLSLAWQSSDSKVASISQQGVVTALRPGKATLTATAHNGVVGKCEITVPLPLFQLFVWTKAGIKTGYLSTDEPQFNIEGNIVHFSTNHLTIDIHRDTLDKFTLEQVLPEHPKSITMSDDMLLGLGTSAQLDYKFTPVDAQTTLKWFNDNPEVVSVTQSGLVSGIKVGEANLMVQTSNGLRASCHIIVPEPRLCFYVWLRNGEINRYDLEDKPEVKLGETIFTLTTTKQTLEYQAADILRFTLQDAALDDPDGISVPEKMDNILFREGTLLLAGCTPHSSVHIYDTTGRLVQATKTDAEGNLGLSLAFLRAGIYLISTEKSTIKIQKR